MIRPGQVGDLPAITRIRTAVTENHLSVEGMAERGITQESIAAEMREGHLACWVALEAGDIAGFSMADRRDGSIFALFMAAAHEGKGHGAALLAACEDWLRQHGTEKPRLRLLPPPRLAGGEHGARRGCRSGEDALSRHGRASRVPARAGPPLRPRRTPAPACARHGRRGRSAPAHAHRRSAPATKGPCPSAHGTGHPRHRAR